MKSILKTIFGLILIFIVFLAGGVFYIVNESEQVVITKFGEPIGDPIYNPGLKTKIPFLHTANYFDKRFLAWDGEPKQVSTRDKRFININTYARWRISDPLKYAERLFAESKAQTRLGSILEGATQNAIANHDLIELVRSSNRDYDNQVESVKDPTEKAIIKVQQNRLHTCNLNNSCYLFSFTQVSHDDYPECSEFNLHHYLVLESVCSK